MRFVAGCGSCTLTDWAVDRKGSRQQTDNTARKRAVRMVSSSIQFASRPLGALAHDGIQIRGLLKSLEPLVGIGFPPFEQEVDQGHLDEGRLLFGKRVQDSLLHLGLPPVTAKSVERGQTHVDARVITQSVKQSRKHLRIELRIARAPAYAFESRAGRLLLQHRNHHQLLYGGEFGLHRSQVSQMRFGARHVQADVNTDGEQGGAPCYGRQGRTKPLEDVPNGSTLSPS